MSSGFKFRLDRAAVGEWMRHATPGIVAEGTAKVAANARAIVAAHPPNSDLANVDITSGVNLGGRPFGLVTIAHPYGLALQAKYGVLTSAAAQAGIDVRRR